MQAPVLGYKDLLSSYLRPQRGRVAVLGLLLAGGLALELSGPWILRAFIDQAAAKVPIESLTLLALLFLGVALLTQIVVAAQAYVAENVGLTATNRLRSDLTLHALQLDPSFHGLHAPGELIERVDGDVATLGNFFSRFVVQMLGNGILLVGVLVLMYAIDWRIGLAISFFVLLTVALVNKMRDVSVPYWKKARQASAELFGFLEERLSGTEDIRSNGATAYAMHRLYERSRNLLLRERRAALIGSMSGGMTVIIFTLGTAISLGLGVTLFQAGAITLGTVYLIFSYTESLRRPIDQITRQLQDLQLAGASINRISDLMRERTVIHDGSGPEIPQKALSVHFDRVTFGYSQVDQAEPVLRDISFRLEPGEVLGVLGRTGSGKTTLTRLLFRLYDPQSGRVLLDGTDLRDTRIKSIRQGVGMVTQSIHLFHATLRNNLTLFDNTIPDGQIIEVLHELGMADWLRSMPQGLDTKLAPGGSGLSAGEGQLVAFARVFLKSPGLVILDEASSRLDPATERQVERAVDKLLSGRTAIVIAHRLATVQRAGSILILEDGQIIEYGNRRQLLADPDSVFSGLMRTGMMAEVLA
ncbi:MAG TPA: ABC transporter ATP-binding protein [Chloroflexia bacterium]|nr:ABC transporter ATP-binding protein [Chloroflexia bacterium]